MAALEERRKISDDVLNKVTDTFNRSQQRLTLDNPRFIQRYVESELQMLVHFVILGFPDEEYLANFRYFPCSRGCDRNVLGKEGSHVAQAFTDEQLLDSSRRLDAVMTEACGDDSTMFVDVVKSMENPEEIIPSFVRLDRAESFYNVLPQGLYWSEGLGFRLLGRVENREVYAPAFIAGVGSSNEKDLKQQMIQNSASEVQPVPEQVRDGIGGLGSLSQIKESISSLLILLSSDQIWLCGPKLHNSSFKITALFVGPFEAICH